MNRVLFSVGRYAPRLVGLSRRMMRSTRESPKTAERMLSDLPDVDKAIISGAAADRMLAMTRESFS
jgi:hypothetical protein